MKIFRKDLEKEEKCKYPFGSGECGKFLKSNFSQTIDDVIEIDEGYIKSIEAYHSLVDMIKELESDKKAIEHQLQNELRQYETGICKDRIITWKSVSKTSIDTKRLKEELPEIASAYSKISTSRTFKIK